MRKLASTRARLTGLGLGPCILLLTALGQTQVTVDRVIPAAAAAGDLIIIQGVNLQTTTSIEFTASVGGGSGQVVTAIVPESVANDRLTARVPSFTFAAPSAPSPADPIGSLRLLAPNGRESAPATIYYLGATFWGEPFNEQPDQTTTLGTGTSLATGRGKPVISFELAGGPPTNANANFVARLENGMPGQPAVLMLGFPKSPPFLMFRDGEMVLDLFTQPFIFASPVAIDASGDARLPLPIPFWPGTATLAMQWLTVDQVGIAVSNGFVFILA